MTDEELLQGMQSGNQASFEALIHRYHAPLSGFLQRQLRDPGRAEDFAQETFLKLIKQLHNKKPPDNVQAWLYRVALNMCRDYWKSAQFRTDQFPFADPPEQRDAGPSVVELAERQETKKEVLHSLEALPEVQREIITLRFYQDLKLQDIADIVSLPLGSVKTHLYSGLRKLKARLGHGRASKEESDKGGQRYEHTKR
ncbi:RNA polymerase sigma factor [Paenibacillus nasutitermitis]|uniref:RNA polymerase sigma factor n=1 Tax=Paenibacillus nasutitermitis TaxID=1652958 RepID=A0A916YJU5_9BACL|nr:RNA polymerase sigma factor [Paenibacillus nasutitermitis]GGD48824.1 RNA polymerase sigma factor [Paenibacillus nasutitermitis]